MTDPYPYALSVAYKDAKFTFHPQHVELLSVGAKLVLSVGEFHVELPTTVTCQVIEAMTWDQHLKADMQPHSPRKNDIQLRDKDLFEPFSPPLPPRNVPAQSTPPPPPPPFSPSTRPPSSSSITPHQREKVPLLRICSRDEKSCKCSNLHGVEQDPEQIPNEQQKAICVFHLCGVCSRREFCTYFHVKNRKQLTQSEMNHMFACYQYMRRRGNGGGGRLPSMQRE